MYGMFAAAYAPVLYRAVLWSLPQAKEPASTMQAFEKLFDGVTFKKGTEVAFATHHKGQLVTQIDGKQVREERALARSLLSAKVCVPGLKMLAAGATLIAAASVLAAVWHRLAPFSLRPSSRHCLTSTWALTPSAAMQSGRSRRAWLLC
jgi:hypothetical protein